MKRSPKAKKGQQMARHLSLSTVRGALSVISNGNVIDAAQSCGCTESDWKLLTGSKVWIGVDRPRVKRLLDSLIYGVVDTLGLPRFELPAEYAAACIAMFVSPINYFPACSWVGTYARSEDLADYHGNLDAVQGLETVSSAKLFALVMEISGGGMCTPFAEALKKKTGIFTPGVTDEKGSETVSATKQKSSQK